MQRRNLQRTAPRLFPPAALPRGGGIGKTVMTIKEAENTLELPGRNEAAEIPSLPGTGKTNARPENAPPLREGSGPKEPREGQGKTEAREADLQGRTGKLPESRRQSAGKSRPQGADPGGRSCCGFWWGLRRRTDWDLSPFPFLRQKRLR